MLKLRQHLSSWPRARATVCDAFWRRDGAPCRNVCCVVGSTSLAFCSCHLAAHEGEQLLLVWPVISVNEWGTQQRRVLALSSKALYRLHYRLDQRKVDHHSSVSLGDVRCIERGRLGYKVHLSLP